MSRLRSIIPYLPPIALLATLYVLLGLKPEMPAPWIDRAAFRLLPSAMFLAAAMLGWRFNQAKFAFLGILLGGFHLVLMSAFSNSLPLAPVRTAAAMLLPLNFLVFYFIRERGLFNRYGLPRALAALAQAVQEIAVGVMAEHEQQGHLRECGERPRQTVAVE